MWWKILIAVIIAFNALIAYACCVVGARADRQMEEIIKGDGRNNGTDMRN